MLLSLTLSLYLGLSFDFSVLLFILSACASHTFPSGFSFHFCKTIEMASLSEATNSKFAAMMKMTLYNEKQHSTAWSFHICPFVEMHGNLNRSNWNMAKWCSYFIYLYVTRQPVSVFVCTDISGATTFRKQKQKPRTTTVLFVVMCCNIKNWFDTISAAWYIPGCNTYTHS